MTRCEGRICCDGRFVEPGISILPDGTRATAIYEDSEGALWFGCDRGLVKLEHGKTTTYGQEDGLAGTDVKVIVGSADGGMWVGGYGGLSHVASGANEVALASSRSDRGGSANRRRRRGLTSAAS